MRKSYNSLALGHDKHSQEASKMNWVFDLIRLCHSVGIRRDQILPFAVILALCAVLWHMQREPQAITVINHITVAPGSGSK
jgi:hypothetical protein